jgi:hypothetical protein
VKSAAKVSSVQQVSSVLERYHEAGVLDLDKSVRDMIRPAEALSGLSSPGSEVAAAVIAWDGYALVIASNAANPAELANVSQQLRQITERQV